MICHLSERKLREREHDETNTRQTAAEQSFLSREVRYDRADMTEAARK